MEIISLKKYLNENAPFRNYYRNMRRAVTHWYTKDQPIFENTEEMMDCRIDVTRIPGGTDTPPCLKISHNLFETMEKANWEFLRLSLPVTCMSEFISEQEKARRWDEIKLRSVSYVDFSRYH